MQRSTSLLLLFILGLVVCCCGKEVSFEQSIVKEKDPNTTVPIPQSAPQSSPQPTPQSVPQSSPQSNPQSIPQSTSQPNSQLAPQPTPQSSPQSIPQSSPQSSPQPTPQSSPQSTPQSNPQSTPQPTSQASPQSNSQLNPEPTPQSYPPLNPQSSPQSDQLIPQSAPLPAPMFPVIPGSDNYTAAALFERASQIPPEELNYYLKERNLTVYITKISTSDLTITYYLSRQPTDEESIKIKNSLLEIINDTAHVPRELMTINVKQEVPEPQPEVSPSPEPQVQPEVAPSPLPQAQPGPAPEPVWVAIVSFSELSKPPANTILYIIIGVITAVALIITVVLIISLNRNKDEYQQVPLQIDDS